MQFSIPTPCRFRRLAFAFLTALLLLPQAALADLMLYPTRLVFEKNTRTAQVDLINNGSEPTTYRISVVNQRMGEDGQFLPVDTPVPGELFANDMVQFSPRQVTLQPGSSQTVRVMIRKPASLAPGEYRSHLHFEKMPEPRGANSVEPGVKDKEIGIVLTALVGASIPVIVRHEVEPATVSLSHLELLKAPAAPQPTLALQFDRAGNSSVYGDLAVGFTPNGGAEKIIARANGLAVYNPNPLRRAKLPLQVPAGVVLAHGTLRVTYSARPEAGGAVLAEGTLPLP
ncbi:molecular chaperone [Massilia sp. R2A-15]|uniref:molecular chaperone n=1 Tax=Massilia sp. R2A-15 TaxID=3064278 RepID=UPI002732CADA|nr:molecular chaperone [Massilia sp. R2A-15]WLI90871.1 molecular chaperone [Massilia sp. R2A-15]